MDELLFLDAHLQAASRTIAYDVNFGKWMVGSVLCTPATSMEDSVFQLRIRGADFGVNIVDPVPRPETVDAAQVNHHTVEDIFR